MLQDGKSSAPKPQESVSSEQGLMRNFVVTKKIEPVLFACLDKECLDTEEAYHLKKVLENFVKPDICVIALDLSSVKFISTIFFGTLIELHHDFVDRNKKMVIIGLNEHNRKVVAITKLDKVLNVHNTFEEARKAMSF